ncbi:dipeptidyl-peptidase 7. Serine peptidase. MEROPS family S46 [Mariniphaga anaerophila]|uniref:Dipeptidyl-peptidase n=1 Tax=Mariniphaga anaerophila TaxID=1484053 RepID=A0A1M5CBT2_9BACT|nr:S46 family peptidase [Mariniphaga anaerophila]SHF52136.1 dipeptidyl-peptidase 7. Serine peptidase. MEROPS family S46 [Mariniphaga anaerophila]
MRRLSFLLLLTILLGGRAMADEGMWLPSLIQKLNISDMQQMGFELSAEDIYSINNSSLKDAVVALDRGSCTAELISKEGLLLTNHHCGFDEIQNHSSVEHDYLQDGFWAMTREEELPNPGKTVSFLVRIEDVTQKVTAELSDDMTEEERTKKISSVTRDLEKEAKGDTHYETYVRSFFNSNQFFLFVLETFNDVRLVGAPPQALGKFGGDTDNWMWPRHTADFSLFRVYSGPDGKPASYSEDNIPYSPKHFFPVSLNGIKEGDFAMIMGYPGRTNRYETSYGVEYTMNVTNPVRIQVRGEKLGIIDQYMSTSQKARIQYASKYAGSSNYYKYSIGQNRGLENLNVVAKKKDLETKFTQWVNADDSRKQKYGEALESIKEAYENTEVRKAQEYMAEAMVRGPEIFMFSYRALPIYRLLGEGETRTEFMEMIKKRVSMGMDTHFKDYDAETDQKVVASLMKLYADNVDPKYHPAFFAEVLKKYKGDFGKYAEKMFKKSVFDDKNELAQFLENPKMKDLEKDMAFQAALDIFDKFRELNDLSEENEDMLDRGNRLFLAGLMEMENGTNFYPDANSTMRVTYGQVHDYEPRDGVIYKYFTTADGYLEKEIPGDSEFDVPARMKELLHAKDFGRYAAEDGELHTCFITNNDITGGNSGSPVLNANGELIGVAFDGNWEAMSGDIAFEPELQRCINVDIRFVLWIIDKYAGATHLIDEMNIVE